MDANKRLCSFYLRDVYSLAPRLKLDKCRQVSRHLNAAVVGITESQLPRYHYSLLEVFLPAGRYSGNQRKFPLLGPDDQQLEVGLNAIKVGITKCRIFRTRPRLSSAI